MIRAALAPLLLALAAMPAALPAAEGPAEVRLLAGWRETPRLHVAAVEIAMQPGWHTYWRVPGPTGFPPSFDWSGSKNLRAARVEWPHPEVFDSSGFRTIGYHDTLVLPVLIEAEDPALPVELDLSLSYGICLDICIQADAAVTAHLPASGAAAETRGTIESALARRAQGPGEAGIAFATCALEPNGSGHALLARVHLAAAPDAATIAVIESARPDRPDLWFGEARSQVQGTVMTARAPVEAASGAMPILDRSRLRLTLIAPDAYVELDGCRAPD